MNETWQIITGFLTLILGVAYGNFNASKKNKTDANHSLIDQYQEDQKVYREEIAELKRRVDELFISLQTLQSEHGEVVHENRTLKWKLDIKDGEIAHQEKVIAKKDTTINSLRQKIKELEKRVDDLERREMYEVKP